MKIFIINMSFVMKVDLNARGNCALPEKFWEGNLKFLTARS
jgi:hypothetical protein